MQPSFCAQCGASLPDLALSCPECHQLVHAAELERLAALPPSEATYRQMLLLLPPESRQANAILERIVALPGPEPPKSKWLQKLGPVGIAIALILSKAKFLLLGLGKLKTLLSMLASIAFYWSLYGWQFGAGFIIGIYIHEMGHVWALNQFGLRASAPMFIPGFGAFVSLYDSPANEDQDARIGLAGPIWGTAAALVCLLFAVTTEVPVWRAIMHMTAVINLFNLTPVWMLDGGRGFRALTTSQRIQLTVLMGGMWAFTGSGIYFILILGAAWRLFKSKDPAPNPNFRVFAEFAALLIILGILTMYAPVLPRE